MAKALQVYFHEHAIGTLIQDEHGDMGFTYNQEWITSPNAMPISCSLPLQSGTFNRRQCQAFFSGLLPEEEQRIIIAKNLGISARNDFSMLEKIGGECAGALSFIPIDEPWNNTANQYHKLDDAELTTILTELPTKPLLAGERGIRLSLAGVQDKLAVYVKMNKIYIPLHHSPSTHILKPAHKQFDDLIYNEHFCLTLANQIGLHAAEATIHHIDHIAFLLIKRYDRIVSNTGIVKRLHQEDFCQALGIPPTKKYQSEEGPSLKQCFKLIRDYSKTPVIDLTKLLDAVIFNFLIGNCDAHGKNFSLLYMKDIQLAPLYDLVCTLHYDHLDKKMAMKLGGEYDIRRITPTNFEALAQDIGFSKASVRKRLDSMREDILTAIKQIELTHPTQEKIAAFIRGQVSSQRKNNEQIKRLI